ncbi:phosphoglycolate phosphatase [Maricaulis salignorans]|uniref:Phosphoglycolate phosphatase n=1 Tax=Maricaulis salignorans TaxID=144026 RepID=A0A1G9TW91_9PROT|nr:phosphoglycolate phosphatase [Maricaulis salignorans]
MTLRYDLVVFDFDGTLADSLTWFRTALSDVVEKHGLSPICEERAEALRGMTPKAIMDELQIPAWKLPFIAADVRDRAARNVDQITLFDGIADLLRELSAAKVSIAVVSSNGEDAIRQVMGPDLVALVSHFACGAALFGKAAVFRKVIRKAGSTPERTLCIGDEVRDIDAAREAGCGCGAVTWGFATPEILAASEPDHLYKTPGDIARCIAPTVAATQRA